MMKIIIAEHAGYCYGVQRALDMAREVAETGPGPIYTLGPIIHNPQVVESLEKLGIHPIQDPADVEEGVIIIRTHGVGPEIIEEASSKSLSVLDATCPFVKKVQQRAAQLVSEGYELVIVGEADHPEVIAILAHSCPTAHVIESDEDIVELRGRVSSRRIGVVTQTTQPLSRLLSVVEQLLPITDETKIFNTICSATTKRQESARNIAKQVDLMIVVGGKNSANTTRLAKICSNEGTPTYHIEVADEIKRSWFSGVKSVGITAGASTPAWILDEVVKRISNI